MHHFEQTRSCDINSYRCTVYTREILKQFNLWKILKDNFARFIWVCLKKGGTLKSTGLSSGIISYPINIKLTFGGIITPFSDTPMLNHERDREISPLIGALLREGSDSDADSEAHGKIWQSWMDYLHSFSVFWHRLFGTCWNIGRNIGFTVYQIHPTKNELLAGDQETIKKPWPNSPMKTES